MKLQLKVPYIEAQIANCALKRTQKVAGNFQYYYDVADITLIVSILNP